jgi:hypothetical protein
MRDLRMGVAARVNARDARHGPPCQSHDSLRAIPPCVLVESMHAYLTSHIADCAAFAAGAAVAATVLNNNANNHNRNRGRAGV